MKKRKLEEQLEREKARKEVEKSCKIDDRFRVLEYFMSDVGYAKSTYNNPERKTWGAIPELERDTRQLSSQLAALAAHLGLEFDGTTKQLVKKETKK